MWHKYHNFLILGTWELSGIYKNNVILQCFLDTVATQVRVLAFQGSFPLNFHEWKMLQHEITRKQNGRDITFDHKNSWSAIQKYHFLEKNLRPFFPSIIVSGLFLLKLYPWRVGFLFLYLLDRYGCTDKAFICKAILRQQKRWAPQCPQMPDGTSRRHPAAAR